MPVRGLIQKLHLWGGLAGGLVFVLLAVTGSAISFSREIDEFLNPHLWRVEPGVVTVSLQRAVELAMEQLPGWQLWNITLDRHPNDALELWLLNPDTGAFTAVYVDPYGGQVLGVRELLDSLVWFLRILHTELLLGPGGSWTVGVLGLALAIMTITGVWLWWPRAGQWLQSLRVKLSGSSYRINFDLHRVVGAVASLLLLICALSGSAIIFEDYVRPAVGLFADARSIWPDPRPQSAGESGAAPLSADEALAAAQRVLPEARPIELFAPQSETDVFRIAMRQPGESNPYGRSSVYLDQYSGAVRLSVDASTAGAGTKLVDHWMLPIHSGEIAGVPGQALMILVGLTPVLLTFTGVATWLHKRRNKRRNRDRARATENQVTAVSS